MTWVTGLPEALAGPTPLLPGRSWGVEVKMTGLKALLLPSVLPVRIQ